MSLLTFLFSPAMRASTIAFLVLAPLGLLTMGGTGLLVTYTIDPVLQRVLGRTVAAGVTGDSVWPRLILLGLLWPVGFLCAGWVNFGLLNAGVSTFGRVAAYVAVLWTVALLIGTWLAMKKF